MKKILFLAALLLSACGGMEESNDTGPDATEAAVSSSQAVVASSNQQVAADAGFIADGASISIPTGFVAGDCVFTAALSSVSGSALSTRVTVNNATGAVICKALVQERTESPATERSCVASYTIICAK